MSDPEDLRLSEPCYDIAHAAESAGANNRVRYARRVRQARSDGIIALFEPDAV
jgi:hypothetical protein